MGSLVWKRGANGNAGGDVDEVILSAGGRPAETGRRPGMKDGAPTLQGDPESRMPIDFLHA